MALHDELLDIERGLWTNDPLVYHASLIEEAMLVFPETGVIGRDQAVAAIRRENAESRRWDDVDFRDVTSMRLGKEAALLTYKVTARWNDGSPPVTALATSVYVLRGDDWKLALHQQTPVTG